MWIPTCTAYKTPFFTCGLFPFYGFNRIVKISYLLAEVNFVATVPKRVSVGGGVREALPVACRLMIF